MEFEKLFEGRSWPEAKERLGVMSVDSLSRNWGFVCDERGHLVARSKDGKDALLGRMCSRDDGKFCIEIVVKAAIENDGLRDYQYWYVDFFETLHPTQWLSEVIQRHFNG